MNDPLPARDAVAIRVGAREAYAAERYSDAFNAVERLRSAGRHAVSDLVLGASALRRLDRLGDLAAFVDETFAEARSSPPALAAFARLLTVPGDADVRRRAVRDAAIDALCDIEAGPTAVILRARALVADDRPDDALRHLHRGLDADAGSRPLRLELIRLYVGLKRPFDAAMVIRRCSVEEEPGPTLLAWAASFQRAFLFEEALRLIDAAETKGDVAAGVESARAALLSAQGRPVDAHARAERLCARTGDAGELRRALAYATGAGVFDAARAAWRRLSESGSASDAELVELSRRIDFAERRRQGSDTDYRETPSPRVARSTDHLIVGDHHLDFGRYDRASISYDRAAQSRRIASRARAEGRRAALRMRQGRWSEATDSARFVLEHGGTADRLLLERDCGRYAPDPLAVDLARSLRERILDGKTAEGLPRRIALVGGSNTVMREGWGRSLEAMAQRTLGVAVDNLALGASSSLYGWFRVAHDRLFETHDLVLFEHSLNDAVYVTAGSMTLAFRERVLRAVATMAQAQGGRLALILTVPRGAALPALSGRDPIAESTRRLAREAGIAVIDVTQELARHGLGRRSVLGHAYRNELHYTVPAAGDVAAATLARLLHDADFGRIAAIPPDWRSDPERLDRIDLLPPSAIVGPHRIVSRVSDFYSGRFIRVERGGLIRATVSGWLTGLLVNVAVDAGYVRLRLGDRTLVKNLNAVRRTASTTAPRIMLRQFGEPLHFGRPTQIELAVDVTETDLASLPHDDTPYSTVPETPLMDQALEIAGLIVVS